MRMYLSMIPDITSSYLQRNFIIPSLTACNRHTQKQTDANKLTLRLHFKTSTINNINIYMVYVLVL